MSNLPNADRLSSRKRRRHFPKTNRVHPDARFHNTAASNGIQSKKGFPSPRRKWDSTPAIEREARALESVSSQAIHIPQPKLRAYKTLDT